jgi:hypothetical protein
VASDEKTEETQDTDTDGGTDEGAPSGASPASTFPSSRGGKKKRKPKSTAEVQAELRAVSKAEDPPPVDMKKIYVRVGAVAAVVWVTAFIVPGTNGKIAVVVAAVLSFAAIGGLIWLDRWVKKQTALGALLRSADTAEGRKEALAAIDSQFKKGDTSAVIAKAQLQMQEDPRAALATLEGVDLDKALAPVAGQVRALRATIHLTLGETQEARSLADKLDLGKQQEPKTRVMFAAVAAEAWARTGQGKKAVDTLDLFNPEAPEMGEMRAQLWRARAFAYAAVNDTKGIGRALKKLVDINPHLLGMFVGQKKVHPLLEREAKQLVMKMGLAPRKMVRQRM